MKNTALFQSFLAACLIGSLPSAQGPVSIGDPDYLGARPFCADSVEDQAGQGSCLSASSVPTLGMLCPLSNEFYIDSSSGFVGIGTTQPAAMLDVAGPAHIAGELAVGSNVLIAAEAVGSTIAGGWDNRAYSHSGFIGGGYGNETGLPGVSSNVAATVAGGVDNVASAAASAIGGGSQNQADGWMGTVPGGFLNRAGGLRSFAAGEWAEALHDNTFVWSSSGHSFASTGSDQFLVDASGGIGLNTNEPLASAHVQGTDIGASIVHAAAATGIFVEDTDAVLTLASEEHGVVGSVLSMPHFASGAYQDQWAIYRGTALAGNNLRISFGPSGNWASNPAFLNLAPDGNLGVGINTPSQRLHVNGAVLADNYFLTSDARLKDDVRTLDGSLEKLRALRGVSFVWNRERMPEAEEERQLGFLAQEVREILPELVREDESGRLSVGYAQVVPLLVEAIREQGEDLGAELEALRRELAELREQL